jgi:hypothetical protein
MALLVHLRLPSGVLGGGGVFLTNESASISPPEVCGRCGGQASFALIERITMPLCAAHAASNGWRPDPQESLAV